jgi:hypothetical protein
LLLRHPTSFRRSSLPLVGTRVDRAGDPRLAVAVGGREVGLVAAIDGGRTGVQAEVVPRRVAPAESRGGGRVRAGRADRAIAVTAITVADSRGNDWQVDFKAGSLPEEMRLFVASARLTSALGPGDTITVDFGEPHYSIRLIAGAVFPGALALDQSSAAAGIGTALDSGGAGGDRLLVGGFVLDAGSETALTPGGDFTPLAPISATAVGSLSLHPTWRLAPAADTYRATATISTSTAWTAALVTYR